jgi:hypothetical protein
MPYRLILLIFFIYVIPFASLKIIYSFDKNNFKISKILNILITLVMIWYITGPNNSIFDLIFNFKTFKEYFYINSGLVNANITFISKIIHNCLNFYMIIVVFNLTRRSEKYRRIFIYLLPLLFIFMTLEVNREFFRKYNTYNDYPGLLLIFISIWTSFKFIAFLLIYNSKVFKKFMCLDNKKIKDIMTNNNGSAQHSV